ncbi:MAG: AbrB/MazE/SpoVT family DNA-binding domain-containing protein [Caulobacteraceae bacterium]
MSEVIVGKWGKSLAVRVPLDVARGLGLADGERVDVQARDGDIVIRRTQAQEDARARARAAGASIRANSRGRTLGGITIRELIDEGRR